MILHTFGVQVIYANPPYMTQGYQGRTLGSTGRSINPKTFAAAWNPVALRTLVPWAAAKSSSLKLDVIRTYTGPPGLVQVFVQLLPSLSHYRYHYDYYYVYDYYYCYFYYYSDYYY